MGASRNAGFLTEADFWQANPVRDDEFKSAVLCVLYVKAGRKLGSRSRAQVPGDASSKMAISAIGTTCGSGSADTSV